MIQGAKPLFWSKDFVYEMSNKSLKRSEKKWGKDEIQMQLWTVIDGDVYLEEGPYIPIRYYIADKRDDEYVLKYHIDQTREYKS